MRSRLVSVAMFFAFAGFGSCEVSCGKKKVDPTKAEALIRAKFAEAGADLAKVSCPEKLDHKEGEVFTCTATVENGDILEVEFTHKDNGAVITRRDNVVVMAVVEAKIAEMIAANPVTKDKKIGAASCPKDKKAAKDATFNCSATAEDGMTVLLAVRERDDEGNLSIVFAGVTIEAARLAKQLEAMLARKKVEAVVACGDKPMSLVDKVVVSCKATDKAGVVARLEIQPTSPYGDFDWRIVPATR